jgi:hypothetical protein
MVTARGLHGNERAGRQLAQPAPDAGRVVGNTAGPLFAAHRDDQFGLGDIHPNENCSFLHACTSGWTICRAGVQPTCHVGLRRDWRSQRWKTLRRSVPDRRWKVGREKSQNCRSAAAAECAASPSTPTPQTYKPKASLSETPPDASSAGKPEGPVTSAGPGHTARLRTPKPPPSCPSPR